MVRARAIDTCLSQVNAVCYSEDCVRTGTIMPIKVVKEGDLYSVEVTGGDGGLVWQSPRPMPTNELWLALRGLGCTSEEIVLAFEGVPRPSPYYHFADDLLPHVQAALAGKRETPQQKPFVEAWMAIALISGPTPEIPRPLEDVLGDADSINVAVPTATEIAWAVLRLGGRVEQGSEYGLPAEGRRAIDGIVGKNGGGLTQAERLEEWMRAHPP